MAGRAQRQVARGVAGRVWSGEEWSRVKWQVARRGRSRDEGEGEDDQWRTACRPSPCVERRQVTLMSRGRSPRAEAKEGDLKPYLWIRDGALIP